MIKKRIDGNSTVGDFLNRRGMFFELFLIAFSLGISTSMFASYLLSIKNTWYYNSMIIAFLLSIFTFIYLIKRKLKTLKYSVAFDSFLIFDRDEKTLVSVPKYDFSIGVFRSLEAVFIENKALKKAWITDPLDKVSPAINEENNSRQFIIEAAEYYLLEKLSSHLTRYFNEVQYQDNIIEYSRTDIPGNIFNNRVLDQLSRSTESREAFIEDDGKKPVFKMFKVNEGGEELLETMICNGAVYQRFNLILPKKSKISRINKNSIEIDMPKISIKFMVDFQGYNISIPRLFILRYLKKSDKKSLCSYKVGLNVEVKIKPFSMLSMAGWEYHSWVDSLIEELDNSVNEDRFFDYIGWDKIEALLIATSKPKQPEKEIEIQKEKESAVTRDN